MPEASVIIPVFGNEIAVKRCIDSVTAGRGVESYDVVVVDDGSPEEGLAQRLEHYCRGIPNVRFLTHTENRGFAAAVTTGVQACDGDVVILNSDTVVPGGWLSRLLSCAASSPRVATVTPFTNSGTICTYPLFCDDADLPTGLDLAQLDGFFAHANRGESIELPTGVGFCMYINRDCWNTLGGFDIETFGSGYGEETDFCMRATAAGWSHLLCADLFVYHDGGISFGARRQGLMHRADQLMAERHPSYGEHVERFLREDPAAPLRSRIDEARKAIDGQLAVLAEEAEKRRLLTEKRLSESQSIAADRLSEIGQLKDQLSAYEDLLSDSRDAYTLLETEAEARARAYAALETDYASLTVEYTRIENQLGETNAALSNLEKQFSDLFRDRDETALARDQLEHLADEYRQTIQTLEHALADLETLATARQTQIDSLEAMWGVRLQRKIGRLQGS